MENQYHARRPACASPADASRTDSKKCIEPTYACGLGRVS